MTPLQRRTITLCLAVAAILPPAWDALLYAAKAKTTKGPTPAELVPRHKGPIRPSIPKANRAAAGRIFLEHADVLHKQDRDSFMVLSGTVHFSKGAMQMYCDSAHYYPTSESMDAFGNVRMQQGDTLFIYADELNYDGLREIAYLYADEGKDVRMINRNVRLNTPEFTYDMVDERGYYTNGGVLTDPQNRLVSVEGEYLPATKEANFYIDVHLHRIDGRDTLDIYSDTMYYDTRTRIAEFYSPTEIISGRGTIHTTEGVYDTRNNQAQLFKHSTVHTDSTSTLTGDTILYDRDRGYGEAFGNVDITDSARQTTLRGTYGYYNRLVDSAFVTGRALAMEYSRGDTLYMHGRYIKSILDIDTIRTTVTDTIAPPAGSPDTVQPQIIKREIVSTDSTHVFTAWPRVRFYRSDMQGLCDSMIFVQRDSTLHLHHHPVVWSDDRQIFGNRIILYLNDSTIDRALLPDFAFTAQHIEDDYYNQLTGKVMEAWFNGGELSRLDVSNSVEAIFYPEENDSTINKMVNLQTANMRGWFEKRALIRMKTWPESNGRVTPLYLAKRSDLLLSKFQWYGTLRPRDSQDIFNVTEEMDALMENTPIPDIPIPSAPDMRDPALPDPAKTDTE
ncbi:MAG: LPS export ABC transporter periplasmic protein LptC [Bacteroidales bacterium]|nr:LPS export ABC transporter periplasmic protein LptC [Bacteroidales bacterium]MDD6959900.1 OstA-like protein [Bacteroidales bacterium]MDY6185998.1 OstA-like protein [Muribaculaceae bacterium]